MNHSTESAMRGHFELSRMAHQVIWACLAMAGCAIATPTVAQQAPAAASPEALESVTVTARKRAEIELDVPISMQVLTDKELRDAGITDLNTLKAFGGFNLQQSVSGSTQASGRTFSSIVFRGLQASSGAARENSGALFVDGIFISGGQQSVSTVGLERVEILKGPQNTYFGRNTFGGAINFITKNPPTTFGGEINANYGSRGSNNLDVTIGGPLGSDALTGSITAYNHEKAAQYKASDGGDLGAEKTKSIDGTLYAKPLPGLWLRLRGHYQQDDDSSAQIGYIGANQYGGSRCSGSAYRLDGSSVNFTTTPLYFCGSVPNPDQVGINNVINANTSIPAIAYNAFVNNSVGETFSSKTPTLDHTGLRRDLERYSLQGGYDLPYDANLAFSLGYNKSATTVIWDLDRTSFPNFLNKSPILTEDVTFDTRVSTDPSRSLRGLVGVSYFTSGYKLAQIDYNQYLSGGTVAPTINAGTYQNEHSRVPAMYGSVDYDLTKEITLSFEGRYQQDKSISTLRSGVNYEQSYTSFLPRGIVQFRPYRNLNVWASVAKGVQPTAFDSGFLNAPALAKAYIQTQVPNANIFSAQPTIEDFEVGVKQRLLEDRVEYSLTAYRINWHHQTTTANVLNPAGCPVSPTPTAACPLANGALGIVLPNDAYIRGLEFTGLALLSKGWNVGASVDYKIPKWKSYYDSSLNGFLGGVGAVRFDGNELSRLSKLTAAMNSTYTAPLFNGWDWYTRGDVLYNGASYESNINLAKVSAYTRVNGRLGITRKDTTVELYATNLLDDKHWDYAFKLTDLTGSPPTFAGQGVTVYAPDRREVGVRVRYTF